MFKKISAYLSCLAILFAFCSCKPADVTNEKISVEDNEKYRTVNMDEYGVSFKVPNDWTVDMEDADVDMFCENDDFGMAVYGFFTEDLADDTDYLEIWESQNETALLEYSNPTKLEHTPEFESVDKELETALYSSELDGIKVYSYYVYAKSIENPEAFLWIGFVGLPSDMKDNFDMLENIVDSIEF